MVDTIQPEAKHPDENVEEQQEEQEKTMGEDSGEKKTSS